MRCGSMSEDAARPCVRLTGAPALHFGVMPRFAQHLSPPRPGRVGKARVGARKDGTAHEDPSLSNSPLFLQLFSLKRTSVLPKRIYAPRPKRKVVLPLHEKEGPCLRQRPGPLVPTACWIEPIRLSAWLHRYLLGRRLPLTPALPSAARGDSAPAPACLRVIFPRETAARRASPAR